MSDQQTIAFGGDLAARAARWMDENPSAMALFERFALEAAARGHRFGIGQLAERVRWEVALSTTGDAFKVNNSYRAYVARELIRRHPDLAELIELRHTKN